MVGVPNDNPDDPTGGIEATAYVLAGLNPSAEGRAFDDEAGKLVLSQIKLPADRPLVVILTALPGESPAVMFLLAFVVAALKWYRG